MRRRFLSQRNAKWRKFIVTQTRPWNERFNIQQSDAEGRRLLLQTPFVNQLVELPRERAQECGAPLRPLSSSVYKTEINARDHIDRIKFTQGRVLCPYTRYLWLVKCTPVWITAAADNSPKNPRISHDRRRLLVKTCLFPIRVSLNLFNPLRTGFLNGSCT